MTLIIGLLAFLAANAFATSPNPQPVSGAITGWTALTPSHDTRTVYVSTSGNDGNTGLSPSQPLRTLGAGYAKLRSGYPDWLLLKCGDTWTDARFFWDKRGRSAAEPMLLGSYGDGPRPVLLTGAGSAFTSAMCNLAIVGLHMTPGPGITVSDAVQPLGIVMVTGAGPMGDVLIEDCRIEGFFKGIVVDWFQGARPFNYRVRRSVIADCYSTGQLHPVGAYFAGVSGLLIEECLFDHNGWRQDIPGANPAIFRRNLYVQDNCDSVVLRANIFARSSAEGFQLRSGGVVEDNLCLRNGVSSIFIAGAGLVRNNIVLDSRDLDAANPRGTGIDASQLTSGSVSGNIVAYRSSPAIAYGLLGIACASQASIGAVGCHDNLVYNWEVGPNAGCAYVVGPTVSFTRNKAVQPLGGTILDCWLLPPALARNNSYWSPSPSPFFLDATAQSLSWTQWQSWSGEAESAFSNSFIPAVPPTIQSYAASLGAPASLEAFVHICRLQSRQSWRNDLTARAVGAYFRAGFGHQVAASCSGDFNNDNLVNTADLFLFLNAFTAGALTADVNEDGALNVRDFQTMHLNLSIGCH